MQRTLKYEEGSTERWEFGAETEREGRNEVKTGVSKDTVGLKG